MSDRPSFAESYGRATRSSDLRQRERGIGDTDRLAALAWADRNLASHLYRGRVANDAQRIKQLHELWANECMRQAVKRRWAVRVPARIGAALIEVDAALPPSLIKLVAQLSLNHWLFDVCGACEGRKYRRRSEVVAEPLPDGRDVLSDELCQHCSGTGTQPMRVEPKELRPLVERCVATLQENYLAAGVAAMKKLSSAGITLQEPRPSNRAIPAVTTG